MRLFFRICSHRWAMTREALDQMLHIANREDLNLDAVYAAWKEQAARPDALAARQGRPMDGAKNVTVRDSAATLHIQGPIFHHADIFSEVSGATAIETLALDFQAALTDRSVQSLILKIDSPGGEMGGTEELASMIAGSRGTKPITAYVSDLGASAAYWIASAADEIVAAPTALLGSIGVVMAVPAPNARRSADVQFVSTQSPFKRADPTTQSGIDYYQALVDTLGGLFVESVAKNRDVSPETVQEKFGQGGLLVGQDAVDAGLADRVGTYESLMDEVAGSSGFVIPAPAARAASSSQELNMDPEKTTAGGGESEAPDQKPVASRDITTGTTVNPDGGVNLSWDTGAAPLKPAASADDVAALKAELARRDAELASERAKNEETARIASDAQARVAEVETIRRREQYAALAREWPGETAAHVAQLEAMFAAGIDTEPYQTQMRAWAEERKQSSLFTRMSDRDGGDAETVTEERKKQLLNMTALGRAAAADTK